MALDQFSHFKRRKCRKVAGFTLLEILVALAIFALAASVLLVTDGRAIRQTARVQDKVMASWLADLELNKYYVENAWPDPGKRSSTASLSGREWYLRSIVSVTSQDGLRRVEIGVFPGGATPSDKAVPLYRLTGYVRRPPE
ncbi:type II secretion system minor pseudopilin GspI [Sansalvadorimonas sp. 2012CJ34-2]|uniref:Type II secretion system protein I n=1 Tax=Parendozoicomonas callyspongiae TaxID=2942213 RepID=A0ABT0PID4_9GAMM|nr:type II secretion system minor pseudopilin GspI [Sansalvadorimonas sp. 2012CJ34-2]MCL6271145.1 type II secretion system minor pseudopilin GspI [Sansalvadorimonas sp. 2012CJ34-2]